MTARLTLRPYQNAALQAVLTRRRAGVRRQLVCLPTGAGKTVIFSELARLARRPVLVLAHRTELIQQARDKLGRALGDPDAVVVEQGAEHAAPGARVVVASIRSLHRERLARLLGDYAFGLVIYDECHHAPAEGNKAVLDGLGAFDADWGGTLLGFTATTRRGDGQGLDAVFEELVYHRGVAEMVAEGWLSPLRGYRIATAADLTGLTGGDDFALDELAERIDIEERNALVARSIQELARDRRTLAFCVTVAHATHLARALRYVGMRAGVIHGQLPKDERAAILADFAAERLQVLTNVGVLTEGFDDPGVSCVAMARPTRSEGLYAQCVGRGTRLAPGKRDCLVLDFVDLGDLSLCTLPTLAGLPRGLDLQGETLDEAERQLGSIWARHPGFEVEPGAITLDEIQRRAEAFDPLSLDVDPEVCAISPHAWQSLGSRGLALHFFRSAGRQRKGALSTMLVLDQGKGPSGRGRRWAVKLDGKAVATFGRVEDAVEACDYEVRRMGRVARESALPSASWRRRSAPQGGGDWGEAVAEATWRQHGPRRRRSGPR